MNEKKQEIRLVKIMWLRSLIEDILYFKLNNFDSLLKNYYKVENTFDNNESLLDNKYNFKLRQLNNDIISDIMLYVLKMDRYYPLYNNNHLDGDILKECELFKTLSSNDKYINLLDPKSKQKRISIFNTPLLTNRYDSQLHFSITKTIDYHLFNINSFKFGYIDYYTLTTPLLTLLISYYIISKLLKITNLTNIEDLLKNNVLDLKTHILDQITSNRLNINNVVFKSFINTISTLSETEQVNYQNIKPYRFPTTIELYNNPDKYLILIEYSSMSNELIDYLDNINEYENLINLIKS